MLLSDWADLATVAAALAAVIAISLNVWAVRAQTCAVDVQTLMRLLDDLNKHSTNIRDAADDGARDWAIAEWLNHVEIVAALFIGRRFESVTKLLIKDALISSLKFIRYNSQVVAVYEMSKVNPNDYEWIERFQAKYLSEISGHGAVGEKSEKR